MGLQFLISNKAANIHHRTVNTNQLCWVHTRRGHLCQSEEKEGRGIKLQMSPLIVSDDTHARRYTVLCMQRVTYALRILELFHLHHTTVKYWTFVVGMWQSSHSNSTTIELRTFSADSKFVKFFHVPVVEFEPQVYTICTSTPTGHRNNQLNKCAMPNSLKGPKIILDMANHHVSKDGPFRILDSAVTYLLSDFFGIFFLHFLS